MNSDQFLRFLQQCAWRSAHHRTLQRDLQNQYGLARATQLADPQYAEWYQRQPAPNDPSEFLSAYLRQFIAVHLMEVVPEEFRRRLERIAIGVIPMASVNACVALSPSGDPVILIDAGLLAMVHYYFEAGAEMLNRAKRGDLEGFAAHVERTHRFIVDYYKRPGRIPFPLPDASVPVPRHHLEIANQYTAAVEAFVIAHEAAHIYAGHLDRARPENVTLAEGQSVSVETYERSAEREFEADGIGWDWYQAARPSIPLLSGLPENHAKVAPLRFFEILALVEADRSPPNDAATHPSAGLRLAHLMGYLEWLGDKEAFKGAFLIFGVVERLSHGLR